MLRLRAKVFGEDFFNMGVKLLDTRKTRPLLREFEKYAVRLGEE